MRLPRFYCLPKSLVIRVSTMLVVLSVCGATMLSCTRHEPVQTPYQWLQYKHASTFRFRNIAADSMTLGTSIPSAPTKPDTLNDAMTLDVQPNKYYTLYTTVMLNHVRTFRAEEFALSQQQGSQQGSQQGMMRLLKCEGSSAAQTLFIPDTLRVGSRWTYFGCEQGAERDTVGFFTIRAVDTTISVPAGIFRTYVLREIDNTGVMTDTFIHPRDGIVKIAFLRSRLVGARHVDDPFAKAYECFEMTKKN